LLLNVRDAAPDEMETALAARRAVAAFLRAYAPAAAAAKDPTGPTPLRRLPPHEF